MPLESGDIEFLTFAVPEVGGVFRSEDGGFSCGVGLFGISWGNIEGGLLLLGRNWIGEGVGRVELDR